MGRSVIISGKPVPIPAEIREAADIDVWIEKQKKKGAPKKDKS